MKDVLPPPYGGINLYWQDNNLVVSFDDGEVVKVPQKAIIKFFKGLVT